MLIKKYIISILYLITIIILCTVFVLSKTHNIPLMKFTADPALIFQANPFIGIISNLGVLLWCCTACICFFSGIIIYNSQRKHASFLLYSGVFTTILLFDDFFMIHDYGIFYILPYSFSEKIIFVLYVSFAIWYVIKFHKTILMTNHHYILLTAFVFLGLSMVIDTIFESKGLEYFIEDSLKFIGIISWTIFFIATSYKSVIKQITRLN